MIGKVISYGNNRNQAIDRMYRALSEYLVRGIHTNIAFNRAIIKDPVFIEGNVTTRFVEDFLNRTPKDLFNSTVSQD